MANRKEPKYKRGQKLILEISEIHTHYDDHGQEFNLYRVKGFRSLVFDDNGMDIIMKQMEGEENE